MRTSRMLFESPVVTVYDVACDSPRGGDEGNEVKETPCIAFPLHGCFAVERNAQTTVADANTAMFFDSKTLHRVSHPAEDGDLTLAVTYDEAATADAFGGALPAAHAPMDSQLQLRLRLLRAGIVSDGHPDDIEEAALEILAAVAGTKRTSLTRARLAEVERAKAFVGQHFRDRLLLHDIAGAAKASPFGLARAFPAATGMTLHRYVLALRHNAALDAIAAGETNLTRLAADLGFAHHSHLTKTFTRAFRSTPSALRARLASQT